MTLPLCVVLAEDNPDIRSALRLSFQDDGRFRVVGEVVDGAQAIDAVLAHRPDAIMLDLAMPVLDGLQAIPPIRRRSPATKIVVLSGFAAEQMAGHALRLGADTYLEKSAGFAGLADIVARLCGCHVRAVA